MWRLLYPFRMRGFHFRKQAPIGPYTADFACHHAKLVIEVDGDTHATKAALVHDFRRSVFLRNEGYTVLRFTNAEVLRGADGVYDVVLQALRGRPHGPRGSRQTEVTS